MRASEVFCDEVIQVGFRRLKPRPGPSRALVGPFEIAVGLRFARWRTSARFAVGGLGARQTR